MTTPSSVWQPLVVLLSAALVAAMPVQQAPAGLPQDPTRFVRDTIQHELDAAKRDHTHWRYHLHREDEKNNYDRDVIDTKDGQLARTLLFNGKPLTADQRAKDLERMKKLVEDPNERAKRDKRAKEDEEKAMQMFKAIPDAFVFHYDGEDAEGNVHLSFTPNPNYDAPTLELKVFRSLAGTMWINRAAGRLSRIDGKLFEDVTFGWGLLGRLSKGGTFTVLQKDVGEDHWDIVSLNVNMYGKAVLFKTINRRQVELLSDYHRIRDDLSITDAFQMLEAGNAAVSANNGSSSEGPKGKD